MTEDAVAVSWNDGLFLCFYVCYIGYMIGSMITSCFSAV